MRVPETKLWPESPDRGDPEDVRDFLIADVFTGNPLEGNQLGIFLDGRGLSDERMQQVAREMNYSETVFFLPPDDPSSSDAHVRIFTPGRELPFAGHPTLGSAWVLGELLAADAVTLQCGIGLVPVTLDRDPASGQVTFGRMSQPIPATWAYDRVPELLAALGVPEYGLPVEAYDNGPHHVYVEVETEAALAGLVPDMQALARLEIGTGCFTQGPGYWAYRNFVPYAGVPEDPATGSAAGPLAVHLARHGRIAFGAEIEIRQGAQVKRPSVLYARAEGTRDRIEQVLVGGRSVIVARGSYRLA
jgi:trans-2,3-dihydro-3-hydroxyanthranilate isomerase